MAEHRIGLVQRRRARMQRRQILAGRLGDLAHLGIGLGQEFVQRRIEQPDRHRQARHDAEQLDEIAALHRQELGERLLPAVGIVGHDHLAHGDDALAVEEHVLGAAEADALGAEAARVLGIGRRVGIGAHAHRAHLVGPAHQRREIAGELRLDGRHLAEHHLAGRAVDGDDLARLHDLALAEIVCVP